MNIYYPTFSDIEFMAAGRGIYRGSTRKGSFNYHGWNVVVDTLRIQHTSIYAVQIFAQHPCLPDGDALFSFNPGKSGILHPGELGYPGINNKKHQQRLATIFDQKAIQHANVKLALRNILNLIDEKEAS